MKTAITELLRIEYPILLGGLQWISGAEFVASVAQAGGTGFIPAATFGNIKSLTDEIRKVKKITSKPFGVNISMVPDASVGQSDWILDVIYKEKIPFVETSGRLPADIIPRLKAEGVKILHKVTNPRHAVTAQNAGVDAIVLVGYEAGGHPGMEQLGTFVNLPKAIDSVNIPVIAAGGVCDGKSFAAAMAMGAEGVMMGTRFIATQECPVHENYKSWIVNANISDTLIIQRSIRNAFRAINNEKAQQVLGLEQTGISLKELLPHISGKKGLEAIQNGDMKTAVLTAGQCAGRVECILSVKELFAEILEEFEKTTKRINKLCE